MWRDIGIGSLSLNPSYRASRIKDIVQPENVIEVAREMSEYDFRQRTTTIV